MKKIEEWKPSSDFEHFVVGNYMKMSKEDLALMFSISREQGDKKEMDKIIKIWKRRGFDKK